MSWLEQTIMTKRGVAKTETGELMGRTLAGYGFNESAPACCSRRAARSTSCNMIDPKHTLGASIENPIVAAHRS